MKVLVFDLDNTLCKLAQPVLAEDVNILKELEKKGNKIVICSGKPTYYLCGLARQLGLDNPILVGENGAVIQFGVDLPPHRYHIVTKQIETITKLKKLRLEMEKVFSNRLWFQPNEVCLTPFPYCESDFKVIEEYLKSKDLSDCIIYNQIDCFDIIPKDVSKYEGLAYLSQIIGISKEEFVAVGDSLNDYPMFDFSKTSIGINLKDKSKALYNFNTINEALKFLLNY